MNKFDVVVIGSSIDGLAAAALLAKNGISTLVINHNKKNSNIYHEEKPLFYSWDCAHGVMGYVLDTLNIRKDLDIFKPAYIDRIITPDIDLMRPFGWNNYKERMLNLFPNEHKNLIFYFDEMTKLGEEWISLIQSSFVMNIAKSKKMFQHKDIIYYDFVDSLFTNKKIKSILLANLPRMRTTLPVMAGYLVKQVFDSHYINGGYKKICTVFEKTINDFGSKVDKNKNARNIIINCKNDFNIECENHEAIECKWIISTFDELMTYKNYLHEYEYKPNFVNTIEEKISHFSIILYIKKDFDFKLFDPCFAYYYSLDEGDNNYFTTLKVYPDKEKKQIVLQKDINLQSIKRDTLDYNISKNRMISVISNHIENFENFITRIEIQTPEQIEKGWGYSDGFCNRWAFNPDEIKNNPFTQNNSVKRLLTTGQWGGAWFTSSIAASAQIKKEFIKERL